MRLKALKKIFHEELDGQYSVNEVDTLFLRIIEHYFKITPVTLVLKPEFSLTNNEVPIVYKALDALKKNKPVQQILGCTSFYGLDMEVNEDVLIPRPETEELVEWILSDQVHLTNKTKAIRILDIGTGSGCIAVSLAKNFKNAEVTALDISEKALERASRNAKMQNVNVNFINKDILGMDKLEGSYDIIVSNPPYVRLSEKENMHANVLDYEPHLALFVPDHDALKFYKKIATLAKNNFKEKGVLYFEINQYLGKEVKALLQEIGFKKVMLRKDISGNDRLVKAQL